MPQSQYGAVARRNAFTLIELLVVVAIIAVLISIFLPALGAARAQGRSVKCATNLHHVGQAFHTYLAENNATFPPSYIYASSPYGDYDLYNQPSRHQHGYLHWSWFLYSSGTVEDKAFTCPEFLKGGAPRTNPGPIADHWGPPQGGQKDQTGDFNPNNLVDKQAPRVAFTANAAVVPRNKFTPELSGSRDRVNKLVKEHEVISPRRVVLATEFHNNWYGVGIYGFEDSMNQRVLSKSHRPINPFMHAGTDANEYDAPATSGDFFYGPEGDDELYGLRPYNQIRNAVGLIDGFLGPETNAVGRHHPGGDFLGGTANFLYTDGSVSRKTIRDTMEQREWGDKYYSLTGKNTVRYRGSD